MAYELLNDWSTVVTTVGFAQVSALTYQAHAGMTIAQVTLKTISHKSQTMALV